MDKFSKQVNEEAWLICPNWTEVRRFTKNKNNKDKFYSLKIFSPQSSSDILTMLPELLS